MTDKYTLPEPRAIQHGVNLYGDQEVLAAFAAGLAEGRKVKEGWKLVEISLLDRVADSLGSFCSDHGWSDSDMNNFDDVLALLPAAAPEYKP